MIENKKTVKTKMFKTKLLYSNIANLLIFHGKPSITLFRCKPLRKTIKFTNY